MVQIPKTTSWSKQLSSTVLPEIIPGVTFFTLIATAISVGCDQTGYGMKVNTIMLSILGTLISFAISLRTSSAQERYMEGRKAWSTISLNCRTFAFNIWVYSPPTTLTAAALAKVSEDQMEVEMAKGLLEKRTILNLLTAFPVATKHYLRNEGGMYYDDLYHLCACLPKYAFPSAAISPDADRSEILGLWRTPHQDGRVRLPFNRRHASASGSGTPYNGTISTASSGLYTERDLEKGDGKDDCESIELVPGYNPPPKTMYHHCPPLLMFRPLFRLFSSDAKHATASQRRQMAAQRMPESNIPLQITLFLAGYLNTVFTRGTLGTPLVSVFLAPLNQLQDAITVLERVLTTPLPFTYSSHLKLCIYIYLTFLPFQVYSLLGYLSIVAEFIAAVIFLGFMEIGTQLENPFGFDDSDLNLDHFCALIQQEISEVVSHPLPDTDSYVFSEDNYPFENDSRNAEEILAQAVAAQHAREDSKATWELKRMLAQSHLGRVAVEDFDKQIKRTRKGKYDGAKRRIEVVSV